MGKHVWFRKVILAIAGSRPMERFFARFGMRLGAKRFVAGETLEETVSKVKRLNSEGFAVTLDYLGESVLNRRQAEEAADIIVQTLDEINRQQLDSNVSVKLTQLGLLIDETFCFRNMDRIVEKAKNTGNFVRIDMEDSSVTNATLRIFRKLFDRYGKEHVGIVIQSYLYRSQLDLKLLGKLGANVRIVKGAYSEPRDVAYPSKKDVDRKFAALAQGHLLSGSYTAIATHDSALVRELQDFQKYQGIPLKQLEFQMLYGIAGKLQHELLQEGYRVRVYTPFGKHWYPYFTRRIAERPANLWFVVKGIFSGGKKAGTG